MNQSEIEADIKNNPRLPKDFAERFWNKDVKLWGGDQARQDFIAQFLGWIEAPRQTLGQLEEIQSFAQEVIAEGYKEVVVLGMGGSSLSSLMIAQKWSTQSPIRLNVLDSTVPAEILNYVNTPGFEPETTLYIVASKSGSTVEPLAFEEYIYDQLVNNYGVDRAKASIVAITDPGSQMEARAKERGYRKIFLGEPTVGGRFSLFTVFGMVPAALAGVNIESVLKSVESTISDQNHPGFELGKWLAHCTLAGHDKITFISSETNDDTVGLWAEQLIAESTGKEGKGILPLATEPYGEPEAYSSDRAFILINTNLSAPSKTGLPLLNFKLKTNEDLANFLYSLEIATATAGAILDVNPFDQPNVQAAKIIAQQELAKIQSTGTLPELKFDVTSGVLKLNGSSGQNVGLALANFVQTNNPGDVVTFLAFLPETQETTDHIQSFRVATRDRLNLGTAFGYGPRYLHSTGQYHKGGPNNGLYIVLTAEDATDPEIPGMGASFGQLKMAQALGDIGALKDNDRRVVHVHMSTSDVNAALTQLKSELGIP
jgi:transaldolase / glucose-6-phosphate isomerase